VIFTKRSTSIIGPQDPIYPHPKVTSSVDYEGELGIIVGKTGSQIPKEKAWEYVWGATIINDVRIPASRFKTDAEVLR
jgi:2-keto-4-pentenoate hydratase/2-oxohepta-3-ene-1,7-dioic acid hydratase in catechol pathway